jgi:hypothetical protein
MIIIIYSLNMGAPNFIKQILLAIIGQIGTDTIIVYGFNSSLSLLDTLSSQKKLTKKHQH